MIYALMSLYILEYDKSSGRRLPAISQSASVISRRSTNVSSGSSCSKISCRVSTSAPATNVCHQYSPEILDIKYIKSNVTLFFFDLQLLPVTSIFNQPPSIHPSIQIPSSTVDHFCLHPLLRSDLRHLIQVDLFNFQWSLKNFHIFSCLA